MKKWLIGILIVVAFISFVGGDNNSKNYASKNPFTEPGVVDAIMAELKEQKKLKGYTLKFAFIDLHLSEISENKTDPWSCYCLLKRGEDDKFYDCKYSEGKWIVSEPSLNYDPNGDFFSLNSVDFAKLTDMSESMKKLPKDKENAKIYAVMYSIHTNKPLTATMFMSTPEYRYSADFDTKGKLLKYEKRLNL